MRVAAHRGDSYNYHENTMEAFRQAIAAGADMIETDVHLTKDGELVLIHDFTVDRTTDGKGEVAEKTLAEVRALNAGDANDIQQVPLFTELLDLLKDTEIELNIEIKVYAHRAGKEKVAECVDKVLALVEQYGMGRRILINSFDAYVLEYTFARYGKKYKLHGFYPYSNMYNVTVDPEQYLYCACLYGYHCVHHREYFEYLLSKGIEPWIGCSTTQKSQLLMAADYGAELITTNNPADTLQKLSEVGRR